MSVYGPRYGDIEFHKGRPFIGTLRDSRRLRIPGGRRLLFAAGGRIRLEPDGSVVEGVLAEDTILPFFDGQAVRFQAGSPIVIGTRDDRRIGAGHEGWVERGTPKRDVRIVFLPGRGPERLSDAHPLDGTVLFFRKGRECGLYSGAWGVAVRGTLARPVRAVVYDGSMTPRRRYRLPAGVEIECSTGVREAILVEPVTFTARSGKTVTATMGTRLAPSNRRD